MTSSFLVVGGCTGQITIFTFENPADALPFVSIHFRTARFGRETADFHDHQRVAVVVNGELSIGVCPSSS